MHYNFLHIKCNSLHAPKSSIIYCNIVLCVHITLAKCKILHAPTPGRCGHVSEWTIGAAPILQARASNIGVPLIANFLFTHVSSNIDVPLIANFLFTLVSSNIGVPLIVNFLFALICRESCSLSYSGPALKIQFLSAASSIVI